MYPKYFSLFFIFIIFVTANNVLLNPGFEDGLLGWENWGGTAVPEGLNDGNCVKVLNVTHKWSGAHQFIKLPSNASSISLQGWMKTQNVVSGGKKWEQAQIIVEFVDDANNVVGHYPAKAALVEGTSIWTLYEHDYSVHSGAIGVKVICALGNSIGTAWFDDFTLILKDNKGNIITQQKLDELAKIEAKKQQFSDNHILNGDFENGIDGWDFIGGELSTYGHSGDKSVIISSEDGKWKGIEQKVYIPDGAKKIVMSGWMRCKNVRKGKKSWERAVFGINFLDIAGNMVGDYLPNTGSGIGTTEWAYFQKAYNVRSGAVKLNVSCALDQAKGIVFFDELKISIYDKNGAMMKWEAFNGPTSEGQWYDMPIDTFASGSHYVDWSSLLDAPAGKHGFLKVKNGHFEFDDGTPMKFWGTTIYAEPVFCTKREADSLAMRLSKMGCNILRLHHMDAFWSSPNIFGNKDNTRKLDLKMMQRLDYLIYACKRKGIYIFLDILVHRKFMKSDGVEHELPDLGAKQVGFFSRNIIDLQKEYVSQIMNHVNEYTNNAYKDEPAIVLSEFINESTIYSHFGGDILMNTPYRTELETLWKKSKFKGKVLASFEQKWLENGRGIMKNTVDNGDISESIEFLMDIENNYYKEMKNHFNNIGVRYPLAGSNMPFPILSMIKSYTNLDFIISNEYWDHPQLWKLNNDWEKVRYAPLDNTSQFLNLHKNIIERKAYYKVKDIPYIVTEWNHCYPNEYMLEGVPLVAAYASLQGWDGALQFDVDHKPIGADYIKNFTISRSPEHIAQWVVGAPMFLSGMIQEAPNCIVEKITKEQLLSESCYSDFLDKNWHIPFITKVQKVFNGSAAGSIDDYKSFFDKGNKIIRSETEQLKINGATGLLIINAPKVQGVTGFFNKRRYELPLMEIYTTNRHASIIAVSADNKSLNESERFYLVVVGPCRMSKQLFRPSRTSLKDLGKLPVQAQVIEGEIVFIHTTEKNKIKVVPLSPSGKAGTPIITTMAEAGIAFDLSKGRTHVYEVTLRRNVR